MANHFWPSKGRFYDESIDGMSKVPPAPRQNETLRPVAQEVDAANYRLLIQQLVLCNDEIERLMRRDAQLMAENATLREKLAEKDRAAEATFHMASPRPPDGLGPNFQAEEMIEHPNSAPLRPYLGVEVMDTGSEVVVKNILPGAGADEGGVQINDILLRWNGQPIGSRADFGLLVSQAEIGSIVKLQVERGPEHESRLLGVEIKGTTGPKQPGSGLTQSRVTTPKWPSRSASGGSADQSSVAALRHLGRLNVGLN
jgi:predicted metalloprotease with PDZ domain